MGNKRRPQGEGMVRKREDGRWEGRIVIGHKKDGSFFVFFISLSCFAAYLVALVNNIFTLIISVWLMVALWKNGHRASVLLLVPFIVYLLFQLFICFLWYSLAYGEWKN